MTRENTSQRSEQQTTKEPPMMYVSSPSTEFGGVKTSTSSHCANSSSHLGMSSILQGCIHCCSFCSQEKPKDQENQLVLGLPKIDMNPACTSGFPMFPYCEGNSPHQDARADLLHGKDGSDAKSQKERQRTTGNQQTYPLCVVRGALLLRKGLPSWVSCKFHRIPAKS